MAGELVEFDEAVVVQQISDPLPSCLLSLCVLLLHGASRAGVHRLVVASLQFGDLAGGGVRIDTGQFWIGRGHGFRA